MARFTKGPPEMFAISHHFRMGKPMINLGVAYIQINQDGWTWIFRTVVCQFLGFRKRTSDSKFTHFLMAKPIHFSMVGSSSGLRMTTTIRHISATGRALG